jgi:hypothetical protein
MKKQLSALYLGTLLLGSTIGLSQESKHFQPCNTFAAMEERFALDPSAKASYEATRAQFQNNYLNYSNTQSANKSAAVVYTVPVVFHILHQGGAENVSDAACIAALNQVNNDFAASGADFSSIFAPFQALYINSDIKFMLAKKDTLGNCITGIVRHYDTKTNWDQGAASASNSYYSYTWNPTRYLNIYIVANIIPASVISGGVIGGYTYVPGTWPTRNPHDAIVYRYTLLNPLPSYDARSLSHEIGHWLGLQHTFGSTNNPGTTCGSAFGGDGIADTPDTKGNFNACPLSSTNSAIVCTSGQNPYYQNVENIMDYSTCPKNFTTGQTNAMRTTLTSSIVGRNNLSTGTNLGLSFTDVNGAGICAPIADFFSTTNNYTVCAGGSLTMKDFSYNGVVSSWQWSAGNGAVISSATNSITNITFNNAGTINVTLTATNGQGSSSQVRSVSVIPVTSPILVTYNESFENPGLPTNWSIINNPSSSLGWQQATSIALDGSNSFYIEGSGLGANDVSILQMPVVDLLNNPNSTFKFAYAYARQTNSHNDELKVQFSKDCGGSWSDVVALSAGAMASNSGGVTSNPFVPGNSDWAIVDVTGDWPLWFSFLNSPNVTIRFTFKEGSAGFGNNIYIDAIKFFAPVGINELTKSIKLNLYPNPSSGETYLNFTLSDPATIKINVVDVLGKNVLKVADGDLSTGDHSFTINKDNGLTKGIYFVNISLNGAKMSKKLIIN